MFPLMMSEVRGHPGAQTPLFMSAPGTAVLTHTADGPASPSHDVARNGRPRINPMLMNPRIN